MSLSTHTRNFLNECNKGRLLIQRCTSCQSARHYPRILCPECGSKDFEWFEATGKGTVYSYTFVHRAPSKVFKSAVPYVIALVDLDEGVRLMTNLIIDNPDEVGIGMRVRVTFKPGPMDDNQKLPMFKKA